MPVLLRQFARRAFIDGLDTASEGTASARAAPGRNIMSVLIFLVFSGFLGV